MYGWFHQPQQIYPGTGENCNILIAFINPNQAGGGPIGPQQIKAEKYSKIRSNLGAL